MKKAAIFLSLLVAFFGVNLMADAQTIGYLDFQKVESEYNYAKRAYKELDNKALELQQYIIDKDKQFRRRILKKKLRLSLNSKKNHSIS